MKTALTLATAALALLSFATEVAHAEDCTRVEVQNLRTGQGPLMLAAYADEATFNKVAASKLQLAVTAETMQVSVCNLGSAAAVAFTLFQDLNANGKLDTNAFGFPTEPWGASGKPRPMAAPSWESAHVALDGTPVVVKMSK